MKEVWIVYEQKIVGFTYYPIVFHGAYASEKEAGRALLDLSGGATYRKLVVR